MENIVTGCVNEFEKFIEFIENKKPLLTVKGGVLGKNDSFKLNNILKNKREVKLPHYLQNQYPEVDLMFDLAVSAKFYYRGNDEKGKARLIKTSKLVDYFSLSVFEKYIFLLQTYWTKYEFNEKFNGWVSLDIFNNFMKIICKSKPNDKITKNSAIYIDMLFSESANFLHHLQFFVLGNLELNKDAKGKYDERVYTFITSDLGKSVSKVLISDALIFWNIADSCFFKKSTKKQKDTSLVPFDVFKKIFQDNVVTNTIDEFEKEILNGNYTFKVTLWKGVWRKIVVSGSHTLDDLHIAIQDAFEFGDDHLYAFYIGGSRRTGKPIYCEYASEGESEVVAEDVSIIDLELFKGQKLVYLFDFGDMWEFKIDLVDVDNESELIKKPEIIESKGTSPDQYGGEW